MAVINDIDIISNPIDCECLRMPDNRNCGYFFCFDIDFFNSAERICNNFFFQYLIR